MPIVSDNDAVPSPGFFRRLYLVNGLKLPPGELRYADPIPITLSRSQALILYGCLTEIVEDMDPEGVEMVTHHAMSALLDDLKALLEVC